MSKQQRYDLHHFKVLGYFYKDNYITKRPVKYALVVVENEPNIINNKTIKVDKYYDVNAKDLYYRKHDAVFHDLFTNKNLNKNNLTNQYLRDMNEILPQQVILARKKLHLDRYTMAHLLKIKYVMYVAIEQGNLFAEELNYPKLSTVINHKRIKDLVLRNQAWKKYQTCRSGLENYKLEPLQRTCIIKTGELAGQSAYKSIQKIKKGIKLLIHKKLVKTSLSWYKRHKLLTKKFNDSLKKHSKQREHEVRNFDDEWQAPLNNGNKPSYLKGILGHECTLTTDKYNRPAILFYLKLLNFTGKSIYDLSNYSTALIPCILVEQGTGKFFKDKAQKLINKLNSRDKFPVILKGQIIKIPEEMRNHFTESHHNVMIKAEMLKKVY